MVWGTHIALALVKVPTLLVKVLVKVPTLLVKMPPAPHQQGGHSSRSLANSWASPCTLHHSCSHPSQPFPIPGRTF